MLTIKGTVQNVYAAPEGTTKEGRLYGGGWKVQLLCDELLENGSSRMGLETLSTTHREWFEGQVGKEVEIPVGAIGGNRQVTFFISKAWKPPQSSSKPSSAFLKQ